MNSKLKFTGEHGSDSRTYKVSFKRILTDMKDYFIPEWDLAKGGKELVEYFNKINFTESQFRGKDCNRLIKINDLILNGKLSKSLRWQK
jgi:hypothetical protein